MALLEIIQIWTTLRPPNLSIYSVTPPKLLQGFFAKGYHENMRKEIVRENGLAGTLFHSPESDYLIIVVGGSSGGLNESRAELLSSCGFSTLALAYFAYENLPSRLRQIPLEYFEKAIDWVREKTGIQRIGFWGSSRGGELALIAGTLFSEKIDAIAAHVPSSVVYGALDEHPSIPAWTYRNEPIAPSAPFVYSFSPDAGHTLQNPIDITACFLKGMEDVQKFAEASIPVEKLQCPLLLISAEDDRMWPSQLFVRQILDRLAAFGSSIATTHISYPAVGHSPSKGTAGLHPIIKRWFAYGGEPAQNSLAAKDWFEQTVKFFKGRL